LSLDCPATEVSTLTYGGPSANGFAVTYAYNEPQPYGRPPVCSDLMLRFYVRPSTAAGRVGATLSKNGVDYRGWLDFSGRMAIGKIENGQEQVLAEMDVKTPAPEAFTPVKFANVDHRLMLDCGGEELIVDLGRSPDALGRNGQHAPRAELFGSGKLTLAHLALFRDTYYTSDGQSGRNARAIEGRPFTLDENEFFVLGDNSPNSEDGRWWGRPEMASKGWEPPRAGVVPRYYLVGKALFVYWPSGFEFPWPTELKNLLLSSNRDNAALRLLRGLVSLRWIPNIGQLRFIYGGVQEKAHPPQP
jgi:hypothetical protein